MKQLDKKDILAVRPVYRVDNREENVRFFCDVLGLKNHLDEGAMVTLGYLKNREALLYLEESPADWGFRPVAGHKRHVATTIFAAPDEVEQLLARDLERTWHVYEGPSGLAFDAESPEKDRFYVTSGDVLADLVEVDKWNLSVELTVKPDFKGLTEARIAEIQIAGDERLEISDVSWTSGLTGADLTALDTWDIEALELKVASSLDLTGLDADYVDPPGKLASVKLENGLELWLEK